MAAFIPFAAAAAAPLFQRLFGGGSKEKSQSLLDKKTQARLEDFLNNGIEGNPLYGQGQSYLQNLLSGNPEAFANFERPYMENFEQNVIPSISHSFASSGTGAGGLNSSGYQNSVAQAGRGLQSDLAQLRSGLQTQALPQALAYAQQPYTNKAAGIDLAGKYSGYRPGTPGFGGAFAQGAGTGLGLQAGMGGGDYGLPAWLTNWLSSKGGNFQNAQQGANAANNAVMMSRVGRY
jgi:hypothetical protein